MVSAARPVRAFPEGPTPNLPPQKNLKPLARNPANFRKDAPETQNLILVKVWGARACENGPANLESEPIP